MANRFVALVYLNGSSTVATNGIEYESALTINVSFPWNVKFEQMRRRILRAIGATEEQRISNMSYRWNVASNVAGHRFRSVRLMNDEDVEEMVVALQLNGVRNVEIMVMVETSLPERNDGAAELRTHVSTGPSNPYETNSYEMNEYIQMYRSLSVDNPVGLAGNTGGRVTAPERESAFQEADYFPKDQIGEEVELDDDAQEADPDAEMEAYTVEEENQLAIVTAAAPLREYEPPPFFRTLDDTYRSEVPDYVRSEWVSNRPPSPVGPAPEKGMAFEEREDAVVFMKEWHIKEGPEFMVKASTDIRWKAQCKYYGKGCNWKCVITRSSKTNHMWEIYSVSNCHTCLRFRPSMFHRNLDSDLITRCIREQVGYDPSIAVPLLMGTVRSKYGYPVSYHTAWRAKQKVMEVLYGDNDESYKELKQYTLAMERFVPGSVFIMEHVDAVDEVGNLIPGKKVFKRLFWTFGQCAHCFRSCKPFIQIDATFLYGKYKEKLMIAVTQDSNRKIVTLAFAIVEEETTDAWGFFLRNLRQYVAKDMQNVGLISDRHASILAAVENPDNGWAPPMGYHMYCLRHLSVNIYSETRSTVLRDMVYNLG